MIIEGKTLAYPMKNASKFTCSDKGCIPFALLYNLKSHVTE